MARFAQLFHTECEYAVVNVADNSTTVYTGPCILYGVYVNTVLSAHVLPIQDGSTAIVSLAASAAAGTNVTLPGIRFNTSLIVNPDDAATGSVTIAYRPVNV
jgi:predicted transcriptional regulator